MGAAEAEGCGEYRPYRPKAGKLRRHEGRRINRSRGCQEAGATRAMEPRLAERGGGDGRREGGAEAANPLRKAMR